MSDTPYKNDEPEKIGPYLLYLLDNGTEVVLEDTVEQLAIILTKDQIEVLLQWYAKKTNRILI